MKSKRLLLYFLCIFFLLNNSCNEEEEPVFYGLALLAAPREGGETEGYGFYPPGSEVELKAIKAEGYAFTHWSNTAGDTLNTDPVFSYILPEQDVTLRANFSLLHNLSVNILPEHGGTVSGEGLYIAGTKVSLSASSYENYIFIRWTDEQNIELSKEPTFDFTIPERDVKLTAHFNPTNVEYHLTTQSLPLTAGTTTGGGLNLPGTEVNISVIANEGYNFVKWVDKNNTILSNNQEFIYIMPYEDVNIAAIFDVVEDYIVDIDGNFYSILKLENQWWMKENLRVKHFRNGDPLGESWAYQPAYAVYNHNHIVGINSNEEMINAYGLLYSGHAVSDDRRLCPAGWRVPTSNDWNILGRYACNLMGNSDCNSSFPLNPTPTTGWHGTNEGKALKSCRQIGHPDASCNTHLHPRWEGYNEHNGLDMLNLTLSPAGIKTPNANFEGIGIAANFWTQTKYETTYLWYHTFNVQQSKTGLFVTSRQYGFSVRCIKE